jgi:hypothetical protein
MEPGLNLPDRDILFLESLANRLSQALYHRKLDAIGINGSVSPGLTHDDYDRLRKIVSDAKLAEWDRRHR